MRKDRSPELLISTDMARTISQPDKFLYDACLVVTKRDRIHVEHIFRFFFHSARLRQVIHRLVVAVQSTNAAPC